MKETLTVQDLTLIDSPESFPHVAIEAQFDRAKRIANRLQKETGTRWHVTDPSVFQDGALLTEVSSSSLNYLEVPANNLSGPTVILFSKFGDLITTGRFSEPPYTHSSEQILSLVELLERDYKLRFASPGVLRLEYSGVYSRYKFGTWFQRFFCPIYWDADKPHLGQLRWP